jgi:hypothetical protein
LNFGDDVIESFGSAFRIEYRMIRMRPNPHGFMACSTLPIGDDDKATDRENPFTEGEFGQLERIRDLIDAEFWKCVDIDDERARRLKSVRRLARAVTARAGRATSR